MSNSQPLSQDSSKLSFGEFLSITKWVLTLIFRIEPVRFSLYLIVTVIRDLQFILYSYILSLVLDFVVLYAQNPLMPLDKLYRILAFLLAYYIGSTSLSYYFYYLRIALRFSALPKLGDLYARHLTKLGIEKLQDPEINNKLHRSQNSVEELVEYASQCTALISSVVRLVSISFTIYLIFPLFIPLIVLASLPYFLFDKQLRGLVWKFIHDSTEKSRNARSNLNYLYNFRNIPEIYINNSVDFFREKYLSFRKWYEVERLRLHKKWYFSNALTLSLTDVVTLLGVVEVLKKVRTASISVGQVGFFLGMLERGSNGVSNVVGIFNETYGYVFKFKDLYYLFNIAKPFEDGVESMPRLKEGPEVEFRGVSFSYPGNNRPIFKNLNFVIKSGEKVAIVGHNGAGKTTLIKLLCRFYKLSDGRILVNGVTLESLRITDWYNNLGVLLQEYNTYGHLSVRENIFVGRAFEVLDETKMRLAAQSADCLPFIDDFPNKFDQVLDESFKGGIRPSTGQWQKIAIARLFYRDPALVIFDEPTSSIDAVSEYTIFNRIYEFFEGKTVIIVSHRFSTVRNADRIIVLDKGEIIEEGSHDQLMARDGYYSKAFLLQAEGYTS